MRIKSCWCLTCSALLCGSRAMAGRRSRTDCSLQLQLQSRGSGSAIADANPIACVLARIESDRSILEGMQDWGCDEDPILQAERRSRGERRVNAFQLHCTAHIHTHTFSRNGRAASVIGSRKLSRGSARLGFALM